MKCLTYNTDATEIDDCSLDGPTSGLLQDNYWGLDLSGGRVPKM